MKTVIFIDGQNLRYRLQPLQLEEKDIDWGKVFEYLADGSFLRAYWFQAERVAPWEWNQSAARYAPQGMSAAEFRARAEDYYAHERERLERIHQAVYSRIEENFDSVEFRYAGVLKVSPTEVWNDQNGELRIGKRLGEKGVDVALATAMVRLAPGYDHAILVSGDYDYVPAIQAVKDMLKVVTVVSVMRGTPPKHQGHARRLHGQCDKEVELYEADLKDRFAFRAKNRSTGAPPGRNPQS